MVEVVIVMLTCTFTSLILQTHIGILVILCGALNSVMLVFRKVQVRVNFTSRSDAQGLMSLKPDRGKWQLSALCCAAIFVSDSAFFSSVLSHALWRSDTVCVCYRLPSAAS